MDSSIDWNILRQRFIKAASLALELFPAAPRVIELQIVNSDQMRELNRSFRNKDKPTDVLSFQGDEILYLGSIVIDYETAKIQAQEFRHSIEQEIYELFVHGIFHLLEFNHESEDEASLMKAYEEHLGWNRTS